MTDILNNKTPVVFDKATYKYDFETGGLKGSDQPSQFASLHVTPDGKNNYYSTLRSKYDVFYIPSANSLMITNSPIKSIFLTDKFEHIYSQYELGHQLLKRFSNLNDTLLIAYNKRFDDKILQSILKRCNFHPFPAAKGKNLSLCAISLVTMISHLENIDIIDFKTKKHSRKLKDAFNVLIDSNYEQTHQALEDVMMTDQLWHRANQNEKLKNILIYYSNNLQQNIVFAEQPMFYHTYAGGNKPNYYVPIKNHPYWANYQICLKIPREKLETLEHENIDDFISTSNLTNMKSSDLKLLILL